jgi:quercetin dioxygenase-like cupin family protein
MKIEIKRFDSPDETRVFEKGKLELVTLGEATLGRASYEPGWKWSEHVGPLTGQRSCPVDHVGLVLSGRAKVVMDDGRQVELGPGDVFAIGPGHDSWVVGDDPYVSIHLAGAGEYAKK